MPNMNLTITTLEEFECPNCGEVTNEHYVVVNDWGRAVDWCRECADGTEVCPRCERNCEETTTVYRRDPRRYYTWNTEEWCTSCTENNAIQCEECSDYYSSEDINEEYVQGEGWCHICDDCIDSYFSRCYQCDSLVRDGDLYEGNDGEWYCESCIDEHRGGDNLHGYHRTNGCYFWLDDGSRRHSYDLRSSERRMLFLGIELETDHNDDPEELADDIIAEFGEERFECKEDCSLDYGGVEIVSQPMTPAYHLNFRVWERVVDLVRRQDGSSYDSGCCGLHIHLSRRFFRDEDAVYRIDRFFHRFRSQLINFSRRREFGYCHLEPDTELPAIKSTKERKEVWKWNKDRAGRYEAVNNTNSSTVEIRLWRGSLNLETLRATIEMTTGIAIVANSITDELAETLKWSTFKLLVLFALEQQGLPHDDLDAYLERRGL